MTYSLQRAYAVYCDRLVITVNLDYKNTCMSKNKVNSPALVYNDSHISLRHQYKCNKYCFITFPLPDPYEYII